MRIAPARIPDVMALSLIIGDWMRQTPWLPYLHTPEEDRWFIRHLIEKHDVIVLRNWRGVHGFLAREGPVVHCLYVHKAWRGRGLGARLLDVAKAACPRLELWTFQANAGARAFYAREGFVEVAFTDGAGNDEKLPDVRLEWERTDG